MRRNQDETQVTNMAGIRRNLKNLAHNYSDAQIKVREATSNDPWGPSSTLMSEIADLTYNVVAFTEIMQMIWKRLNDHGKNWRHVYKALVLLDYLIKTGSEKVAQQCRENIFAIMTLRDFQYMDDGKDQGLNVREKAKQLVALLREEDRLRAERSRALKAKERFALSHSTSAFGSDTNLDSVSPSSPSFSNSRTWGSADAETRCRSSQNGVKTSLVEAALDLARPQTAGEEELQLQLALAMSREQAEQEEQKRRSDDVRLQLALSQSENEFKHVQEQMKKKPVSHIEELLDVDLNGPVAASIATSALGMPAGLSGADGLGASIGLGTPVGGLGVSAGLGALASPPPTDPWGMPIQRPQSDPWSSVGSGGSSSITPDPWSPLPPKPGNSVANPPQLSRPGVGFGKKEDGVGAWGGSRPIPIPVAAAPVDPWSPLSPPTPTSPPLDPLDEFDIITNRNINNNNNNSPAMNNTSGSPNPFEMRGLGESLNTASAKRRSPHSFLGENSGLVNLDQLVTRPAPSPSIPVNPTPLAQAIANPFSPVGAGSGGQRVPSFSSTAPMASLPQPLIPSVPPTANPFLS